MFSAMTFSVGRRRSLIVGVAAFTVAGLIAGCTAVSGTPVAAERGASSSPQAPDTAPDPSAAPGTDDPASGPTDGDEAGSGGEVGDGAEPTSSALIATALDAGEIDQPTSLLYRLWAAFGDGSLPEKYQGVPEPHDLGLFAELRQSLDGLPGEIRSQVEPYLKRPSDPESIFSSDTATHDDPPGFRSPRQAPSLGQAPTLEQAPTLGQAPSLGQAPTLDAAMPSVEGQAWYDWWSEPVSGLPFRVWAPFTGEDTTAAEDQIAKVAGFLTDHGSDMIADMGKPLPDDLHAVAGLPDDEADDKVDIYVLPAGWMGPYRDGASKDVGNGNDAVTIPVPAGARSATAPPMADSAYVLLGASLLDNPGRFEAVLIHEVFHVLQFAHHAYLDSSWFYEASADWAATHYVREWAPKIHRIQFPSLQRSKLSLHAEEPSAHGYIAYVWPLFMEQEAGTKAIFDTWKALEAADAGTPAEVIKAINTQVKVTALFPEFVMRMLNADLPGDPIKPRFVDVDPTFPDGLMPAWVPRTLGDDAMHIDHSGMPALSYRYSWVEVPVPDGGVALVTISGDLAGKSGAMPTVEALVQGGDHDYVRRSIDITGDGTDVCVNENLLLVVSNPATDADAALSGDIVVERASEDDDDLDCGLVGDLHLEFNVSYENQNLMAAGERIEAHWSGTLSLDLGAQVAPVDYEPAFYPNRGSHWAMSGFTESEACVGAKPDQCIGAAVSRKDYNAATDITNDHDPDLDEYGYKPDTRLDVTDDGLILRAALPVETTLTIKRPNLADEVSTVTGGWDIGCDVMQLFSNGAAPGENGPGTIIMVPDSDRPLQGTWNDEHTAVSFDCHGSGSIFDGIGEIDLTISGTLHVG